MNRWIGLRKWRRPVMLVAVGGSATVLYAALAALGGAFIPGPVALISLAAYALAAVWSYLAHRRLTFDMAGPHGYAPLRFAGLTLVGYSLAFLIPLVVSDWGGAHPWLAIAVTCMVIPSLNALALSRAIFRKPLLS